MWLFVRSWAGWRDGGSWYDYWWQEVLAAMLGRKMYWRYIIYGRWDLSWLWYRTDSVTMATTAVFFIGQEAGIWPVTCVCGETSNVAAGLCASWIWSSSSALMLLLTFNTFHMESAASVWGRAAHLLMNINDAMLGDRRREARGRWTTGFMIPEVLTVQESMTEPETGSLQSAARRVWK